MPAKILKGTKVAKSAEAEMSVRAAELTAAFMPPRLAIVRIGERPDDGAYERGAKKRCEAVGIVCETRHFDQDINNTRFLREFEQINNDDSVHGILVMSPMPDSIDRAAVAATIDPVKDVDCISPVSISKLYSGDFTGHAPCTPSAVLEILRYYGIPVFGSRITVIGRSLVVGKPLSMLLLADHATITICHTRTVDLAGECRRADILIAAAGNAGLVGADFIKPGAAVIDVGINVMPDGSLCGDVIFGEACEIAGCITPVPGGVGAVTTSMLVRNTLDACEKIRRRLLAANSAVPYAF